MRPLLIERWFVNQAAKEAGCGEHVFAGDPLAAEVVTPWGYRYLRL